jgi:hypothetical protein
MLEILEDGITEWIVKSCEEAVQVGLRVAMLSRARCRQVFEERFVVSYMAQDYLVQFQ